MSGKEGQIRTGVGGWTFEPWRGVFYPEGLKHADELSYASRRLTVIEINSTYYSSQSPATFAKWAAATPEDFRFTVKASRFSTNRRVLAQGEESVRKFLGQGLTELGDRLGPILWQFMKTKAFDPEDFGAFLDLLPDKQDGLALRHVVEVRHDSFQCPDFVALCRRRGVAICIAEDAEYPMIADGVTDLAYLRLMKGSDAIETGYPQAELDSWARRLEAYARGEIPSDLESAGAEPPKATPREVFAFVIHEGKVRAPAAAMALYEKIAR